MTAAVLAMDGVVAVRKQRAASATYTACDVRGCRDGSNVRKSGTQLSLDAPWAPIIMLDNHRVAGQKGTRACGEI